MRKWTGKLSCGSLEDKTMQTLRGRIENILGRHAVPSAEAQEIIEELTDEVSWAFAGRDHKLERGGRGRPADGPANLLSVNVADVLMKHKIRGSWLGGGTEEEDGQLGIVAELEAVSLAALREACGSEVGVMARPARISEARKMFGKIERN
jgi:hypothetical protein